MDVGAGDPVRFSNSFHFESRGWTGICIDADPRQIVALREKRNCVVEWAAVTDDDGEIDFFSADDPDYSSIRPNESLPAEAGAYRRVSVPARRLEAILADHSIRKVDLLSIDTEGAELAVCRSVDWEFHQPTVVVVEYATAGRSTFQEAQIRRFFADRPYRAIQRTSANLIYARSRLPRSFRRSSLRVHLSTRSDKRAGPATRETACSPLSSAAATAGALNAAALRHA